MIINIKQKEIRKDHANQCSRYNLLKTKKVQLYKQSEQYYDREIHNIQNYINIITVESLTKLNWL